MAVLNWERATSTGQGRSQAPRTATHLALAGILVLLQAHALQLLAADLVLLLQALALLACHLPRRVVQLLRQRGGEAGKLLAAAPPLAAAQAVVQAPLSLGALPRHS